MDALLLVAPGWRVGRLSAWVDLGCLGMGRSCGFSANADIGYDFERMTRNWVVLCVKCNK